MINDNDKICLENVIMYRDKFHYTKMNEVMEKFLLEVSHMVSEPGTDVMYALNNTPMDEMMDVTFYMTVKENRPILKDGFTFQSYFYIDNMISKSLSGDFEKNTEQVYFALLSYMKIYELEQVTSVYHCIGKDGIMPYMIIKIGVSEKEVEDNNG